VRSGQTAASRLAQQSNAPLHSAARSAVCYDEGVVTGVGVVSVGGADVVAGGVSDVVGVELGVGPVGPVEPLGLVGPAVGVVETLGCGEDTDAGGFRAGPTSCGGSTRLGAGVASSAATTPNPTSVPTAAPVAALRALALRSRRHSVVRRCRRSGGREAR